MLRRLILVLFPFAHPSTAPQINNSVQQHSPNTESVELHQITNNVHSLLTPNSNSNSDDDDELHLVDTDQLLLSPQRSEDDDDDADSVGESVPVVVGKDSDKNKLSFGRRNFLALKSNYKAKVLLFVFASMVLFVTILLEFVSVSLAMASYLLIQSTLPTLTGTTRTILHSK